MKNNTRKLIALVCCMAMICGVLAACGGGGSAEPAASNAADSGAATEDAAAEDTAAATQDTAAATGDTYKLTVSLEGGENDSTAVRWRAWADTVTEKTGGRVTFQFYYDSTLLDASSQMQQLKGGIADIGEAHKFASDGFVLHEKWFGMTAGAPDEALITIGRDLVDAIPELAEELEGIKTLAYAYGCMKEQLLTVKKPVYTVEDVKGMVIWCEADFNEFVKEMGATPVNSPWSEVYSSLQKNMYDGLIIPAEVLQFANLADVCKYVTLMSIGIPAGPGIFMNLDKYNSLPDDIKAVIDDPEVAKVVEDMALAQSVDLEKSALEWSKENKGVEVIELSKEERQKFVDCVNRGKAAMVESFNQQGLPGDEYLAKFVELCAEYE